MTPDLLADLRTLGDKLEHGDPDDKACAVVIFAILRAEAFGNLPGACWHGGDVRKTYAGQDQTRTRGVEGRGELKE
jgi:hypothetical protein